MTAKKQPVRKEPFLNAVARKLGHAAGTLTHLTQGLTETLSAVPKHSSSRPASRTTGEPTGRRQSEKRPRTAIKKRGKKHVAGLVRRKPAASKLRIRTASNSRKTK